MLEGSDPRSKIAVLDELRAEGHDAWPSLSRIPHTIPQQGREPSRKLFSLGGIPDVLSVFCAEGRTTVTYRSDRFGFFNSESAFEPRPRIMIVGDSYIHGYCVGADEGVAPRLRRQFPGTLNFGMSGMGPLAELATLREYGPLLKPDVVIWAFFAGNDWLNLESEKQSVALSAYLDPDHRQELASQRDVIDGLLRSYVEDERTQAVDKAGAKAEGKWALLGPKVLPVLSLHNLLPFLGLPYGRVGFDYELFETILGIAKEEVTRWSGELIFAYLPLTSDFLGWNRFVSDHGIARQRTLAIVREVGLRVVDLHPAIAALPDPMAVSNTPRTHYNAFGYELVAREVAAALEERTPRLSGGSRGADLAMKSRSQLQ